jgi:hypothetical protein
MRDYWSCSDFADKIRGTAKPEWGTGTEWDYWKIHAKQTHPIRYWVVETAFDAVQDFIWWPIDTLYDIKYYCINRWVTKTHQLTASKKDLKPGEWCDVGGRFLPCLFNELVDFVEVELAGSKLMWMDAEEFKKQKAPFWARGPFKTRTWRSRELGMEYLAWASDLTYDNHWGVGEDHANYGKLTTQALNAREIKELYLWWTEVYPTRPDPYDESGFAAYLKAREEANGGKMNWGCDEKTEEERQELKAVLDESTRIEQLYESEDTAMMIRLIKVRDGLWT